MIRTDEDLEKLHQFFETLDEEQYKYYCDNLTNIVLQNNININIAVDEPLLVAYFRIYNHHDIGLSTKVMQLHIKDNKMEYHPDPFNKDIWIPSDKELYDIKKILCSHNDIANCTNWQQLCYQWNYQNILIDGDIWDYLHGKHDKKYTNNKILSSVYVPSTQKMPEMWIYDAEERKKEKFKYW